jgi:hypothetical protein
VPALPMENLSGGLHWGMESVILKVTLTKRGFHAARAYE